mgnify:CR=1 FL=1
MNYYNDIYYIKCILFSSIWTLHKTVVLLHCRKVGLHTHALFCWTVPYDASSVSDILYVFYLCYPVKYTYLYVKQFTYF